MKSTATGKRAGADLIVMEVETGGSDEEEQSEGASQGGGSEGESDPGVIYHE